MPTIRQVLATKVALAQTIGVALVVWHFVFYGYLATWPVLGKLVVMGVGTVAVGFVVMILVTGAGRLAGRAEAEAAPVGGVDHP